MEHKIHIVHVHEKFYPFMGGSTHRLLNLLKEIDYEKFVITVVCENSEKIEQRSTFNAINIIRYDKYSQIPFILREINEFQKIDMLHSHNFRPSFFAYFTNKLFFRKPFIIELHSIYETTNFIKQWIGNLITAKSDRVIVLSESSKQYLIENLGIEDKKINVIYNGIEFSTNNSYIEYEDDRLKVVLKDDNLLKFVYMGSLDSFQGIDNLVEVINKTSRPDIFYLIIGGSKEESKKLELSITNKNVFISPYVSSRFIPYIYKASQALLVIRPSMLSTETAIPLKPIEALLNECKVFSTKVGGMKELQGLLATDNIIFFEDNEEILQFIDNVKKESLCFEPEKRLELFNVKRQSEKLDKLYLEMHADGK